MCGIVGIYGINGLTEQDRIAFQEALKSCESRGRDAFGFYTYPTKILFKTKGSVSDYIKTNKEMYKVWNNANTILAHTRATTIGSEEKNQNNHPFETEDFILSHNGQLWNSREFKYDTDIETDSYVIIKNIQEEYDKDKNITKAIRNTCKKLEGSFACWLLFKKTGSIYLFRHHNPIEIRYDTDKNLILFASEGVILEPFRDKSNIKSFTKTLAYAKLNEDTIYRINKNGEIVELETFEVKTRSIFDSYPTTYKKEIRLEGKFNSDIEEEIFSKTGISFGSYPTTYKKEIRLEGKSNSDIEEEIFSKTGISFGMMQEALDYHGIQAFIRGGKIQLWFSTDKIYHTYRDIFNNYGFTISPKTNILTLSDLNDLDIVEQIMEESDEMPESYFIKDGVVADIKDDETWLE